MQDQCNIHGLHTNHVNCLFKKRYGKIVQYYNNEITCTSLGKFSAKSTETTAVHLLTTATTAVNFPRHLGQNKT